MQQTTSDTTNVDMTDFLTQFGISQVKDESGALQWKIHLSQSASGCAEQEAYFDPRSGHWILDASGPPCTNTPSETPSKRLCLAHSPSESPLQSTSEEWWIDFLPATSHTEFLVNTDWASTPLGPITSWPPSLRFNTYICLQQSRANVIFWGKERIAIYNEACVSLLGNRHPESMGGSIDSRWPEVMVEFSSLFETLPASRKGVLLREYCLFLERHDFCEETWWDGDLFPLKDDSNETCGFSFVWNEITRQVVSERRNDLLTQLGKPSIQHDFNVWDYVHRILSKHSRDVASAIIYSSKKTDDGHYKLKLEATIGIRTSYRAAPKESLLEEQADGIIPFLVKAAKASDEYFILDTESDDFSSDIIENIDWQGYGQPSRFIAVVPIFVASGVLKGFLIVGLNPRLTLDDGHKNFLTKMSRQIASLMTSLTMTQQAKGREERLTQDLAASQQRITRMAELAPMGMYDLSAEGPLIWANNHFFDIVGAEGESKQIEKFSWLDVIHPDDHAAAFEKMGKSVADQTEISDTLRLRRTWCPPDISGGEKETSTEEPAWILYQAYPNIENGTVKSIMGCITDISQFKWAENVQARSADAARAGKQRLEEFIDITSHEMRNPLSAVTQCADDILDSVNDARAAHGNKRVVLDQLDQIADTATSIGLCAAHQRRIIDDVLTLSKLDSALLSVVPSPLKPDTLVVDAMRMFAAEFASNAIQVDVINETPQAFGNQDIAYCDTTRIMQVLVNLITNAIKFTRAEDTKEINLRYGASDEPPPDSKFGDGFAWSSTPRKRRDLTEDAPYGDGATIYLHFSVQDTGQGLPKHEAVLIFDKFIQANRRTYVKYGGSGLGLFISRELIELQSGKIGVASESGKGSTFAFYIKAKRGTDSDTATSLHQSVSTPSTNKANSADHIRHSRRSTSIDTATGKELEAFSGGIAVPRPLDTSITMQENTIGSESTPSTTFYRILLVEDNLVNQKVLTKQLRKAGFSVMIANHGGEAVDYLLHLSDLPSAYGTASLFDARKEDSKFEIDCILMDWEMPVLDGLAATKKIRSLEAHGKIPRKQSIIGVTANARAEQIQMAIDAGMDEVVVKPFKVRDLIERITEVSGRTVKLPVSS